MIAEGMDVGEVMARTELSLRTIRHYARLNLVVPSVPTDDGALYSEEDVARLALLRRIRPMGFSLREIRDLLATLEILEDPEITDQRDHLLERTEMYLEAARLRAARLAEELGQARQFTAALDTEIAQRRQDSDRR
ncbi:MerR family transcriptional regulator [Actinomadura sp. 6K520]|uniref:MerR family transcriptional regulator n=1 Tax=Actinomadura sp. 6K520 TaxID=2530364 RepID=UPI001A9DD14A|nr:MerR family transcriptional regulator [Actinomadura sp. 6K520]